MKFIRERLLKMMSKMGRFERHFAMMKVLSLAAALAILLLMNLMLKLGIGFNVRGFGAVIFLWIAIYITLTIGIALHEMYNRKKGAIMADVAVKKSRIHGMGVFAARNFRKGEVVLRWDTSKELAKGQANNLTGNEKQYVTYLNGKYILMQPPERYVNHSCDSNTHAENFCDIAKRDIRKGEEITADYSEESVPNLNMRCNCGSRKCRRIIKKTL